MVPKAINAGHYNAVTGMTALLLPRDRVDEALMWLEIGAYEADADAMSMLGGVLTECGQPQRGQWWQQQAEQLYQTKRISYPAKTLSASASVTLFG
ncbi:hypothetical protein [Nocardia anaemiae]|uniref:hypothetical protein n=1 Tax=Nocardia anaemiae TaxID=263910 RepID=UPI0007A4CF52|nr:hypothetical protein [Nocardia anaemiae]